MTLLVSISCLLLLLFIHHGDFARTATAVLYADNSNTTGGMLSIYQDSISAPVMITGLIFGLNINNSTAHGFHIHTNPVSEYNPNCTSAGGHFNPYNVSHGPPTANITSRHVGDLGNITANATGAVYVNITDSIIQLYNITQSIINRTIVVHAMYDDGGSTGLNDSAITGNAGSRVFCGLIKLISNTTNTTTTTLSTTTSSSMALSTIKLAPWLLSMIMIISGICSR